MYLVGGHSFLQYGPSLTCLQASQWSAPSSVHEFAHSLSQYLQVPLLASNARGTSSQDCMQREPCLRWRHDRHWLVYELVSLKKVSLRQWHRVYTEEEICKLIFFFVSSWSVLFVLANITGTLHKQRKNCVTVRRGESGHAGWKGTEFPSQEG